MHIHIITLCRLKVIQITKTPGIFNTRFKPKFKHNQKNDLTTMDRTPAINMPSIHLIRAN